MTALDLAKAINAANMRDGCRSWDDVEECWALYKCGNRPAVEEAKEVLRNLALRPKNCLRHGVNSARRE